MIIKPAQAIHMHRDPRVLRKRLNHMRNHLARELTNHLPLKPQLHRGVRPRRQIHHGARERLIEGCVRVAESLVTHNRAESLLERGTESERAVFCGVVVVDYRAEQLV